MRLVSPRLTRRPVLRPRLAALALRLLPALAVVAPLAAVPDAHAQTVGARQRLVLSDGSTLVGTVVEVRADAVVLESRGIRSEVPRSRIARVEAVGRFDRVDPLGTRLFFTPTARTMPRGSVRISTIYYGIPNVAVGLTGNVDASLSATIPVADGGAVTANLKFAPVQTEGLNIAVGGSAGTLYGQNTNGGLAGTFYGVATIGDARRAVTLGAYGLYAGYDGDFEVGKGVALVLGGETQVSNHVKIITENALFRSFEDEATTGGVVTGGVRFFSDRLAADISYPFVVFDGEEASTFPIPIPLVSFSYTIR